MILVDDLVGTKQFGLGRDVCQSVLENRNPSDSHSKSFDTVLTLFFQNATTLEGEYSFLKLVLQDLTTGVKLTPSSVKTVYSELTQEGFVVNLPDFSRLIAYRAFDLLVVSHVEPKFDTVQSIVEEIQTRSEKLSIRDWGNIALSMNPKIAIGLFAIAISTFSACFGAGVWWATPPAIQSQAEPVTDSKAVHPPKE